MDVFGQAPWTDSRRSWKSLPETGSALTERVLSSFHISAVQQHAIQLARSRRISNNDMQIRPVTLIVSPVSTPISAPMTPICSMAK